MPSDKDSLCNFWLKVTMDQSTKRKQLMSDSIIEHNDYSTLCPAERFAGASDLRLDKMEIFNNYAVMVSFLLQYKILRAK